MISLFGTALGVCSRMPQIYRVWARRSGADLSSRALCMNISANVCFATYPIDNNQLPILFNNCAIVALDGILLMLRTKYTKLKKNASEENLATHAGPPDLSAVELMTQ